MNKKTNVHTEVINVLSKSKQIFLCLSTSQLSLHSELTSDGARSLHLRFHRFSLFALRTDIQNN